MDKNYSTLKGIFSISLVFLLACVSPAMKGQVVQTFSYTGAMQSFTVPALCVTTVTLEVWGAQGGANWINNDNYGGYASAVFNVSAGDVLNVFVGQQPNGITGGYNGGGNGEGAGQGGGGGTDIRLGGVALANRIIVAGGGGGAGYWSSLHVVGGQGGGLAGTDGYRMPADPGGQGGTQVGSGSGTCVSLNNIAMTGGLGYGGAPSGCGCEGYGGGGGYYGGAGSGNCRGGGGGSGYILPAAAAPNYSTGVRVGHGQARISYITNGASVAASVSNPLGICPGGNVTLNASGVLSYTWTTGSNATSIPVSPVVTTTYGVSGTNGNGCISSVVLTVSVNPLPTLSLSATNTFVCKGQTATLTAQGAATYAWTSANGAIGTGSVITVSPTLNASSYVATGTSAAGCVNTETINLTVNPLQLTVTSNTSICKGKQVLLTASGTTNYNWTNNMDGNTSPFQNFSPSPTVTTIYSVSGLDANNCILTETVSVTVNQIPNVLASTSKTLVCKGMPITISASGATTYMWNTNDATQTITVTPALDTYYSYVVTGTDSNSCTATATVVVKAELCTSMLELANVQHQISVFPNPNNGLFTLETGTGFAGRSVKIYSVTGALIKELALLSSHTEIDLQKEPNGIYFVHVIEGNATISVTKIVKE